MSLLAKNKYQKLTFIEEAIPGEMYYCQVCGQPMMQKRGEIRIHHFSHYSPHGNPNIVPCSDHWGYDKTDWHMEWQKRFPIDNMERVLEHNGEKHIADILIDKFVIEFQHSPISLKEFSERNAFYTSLGYKVIWLFDLIDEYSDGKLIQGDYEWFYKWAYAKKLFREMDFNEVKATIYFQLSDEDDREVGVIERVKEIRDDARVIKTDQNNCYSIKEFVELISANKNDVFEKPKAPNSIDNCKSIGELWDESFSAMIIKNKHTNDVVYVFGKDGHLIRDYQTGKVRCKYTYQDPDTGYYIDKGNYYNVQDENKKIWVLIHSYKDKNYEQRMILKKQQEEKAERERQERIELNRTLKAAERDDCETLLQLTRKCNGRYLYVDNVLTGKRYFVKLVNGYLSFNIYEVDKNNISVILSSSLNGEMSKQYQYKVWKLADVLEEQ